MKYAPNVRELVGGESRRMRLGFAPSVTERVYTTNATRKMSRRRLLRNAGLKTKRVGKMNNLCNVLIVILAIICGVGIGGGISFFILVCLRVEPLVGG